MSFRNLVIMVTVLLIVPMPSQGDDSKKDTEKIQGTWKLVSLEVNGGQGPAEVVDKLKLVFKEGTLTFMPGEPGYTNYICKLDPATKPPSFDMTHADGKKKGDTMKGIYSLDGDDLKICFGKADQRPREFTAKTKSGQAMYVLKREKP